MSRSALQLENASIRFNCLLLRLHTYFFFFLCGRHPFTTRNELVSRILQHYKEQALSQIYKLLGSFDVIGNPISLVDNLGTGFTKNCCCYSYFFSFFDFFHEPAQGIVKSPHDFGKGLAKVNKLSMQPVIPEGHPKHAGSLCVCIC